MEYYPSSHYLRNGQLSESYNENIDNNLVSSRMLKNVVDEHKNASEKIVRHFHARYAMQVHD